MTEEKDIGWMYQGAKSSVNREDYLLGKRVDKNFEKYSDAVVDQREEAIESIVRTRTVYSTGASLQTKVSTLDLNTVRTEDPLVAVKVKEETRRQEMMSNPLMRMRFEKLLKEAMTKEEKKKNKKKDKKKDSDSESGIGKKYKRKHKKNKRKTKKSKRTAAFDDSDSSASEINRKLINSESPVRRKISPNRNSSDSWSEHHEKRESSEDTKRRRRRSSSRKRCEKSRTIERHDHGKRETSEISNNRHRDGNPTRRTSFTQKRARNSDSFGNSLEERKPRNEREDTSASKCKRKSYGMEVPEHIKNKLSPAQPVSRSPSSQYDREEEESKKKFEGYGLVGVKKKCKEDDFVFSINPYSIKKLPTSGMTLPFKKPTHRPRLTDEEKVIRLTEMQTNADWRDATRKVNLKKAEDEDRAEEEKEKFHGKAALFIRPMLNAANDTESISKRLQMNKKNLQKEHDYIQRKFTQR